MFIYPNIHIMLINWNGSQDTLKCLHSLANIDYPREYISIWIADNGSSDNSLEVLDPQVKMMRQSGWQMVNLLKLGHNFGSPGAFNQIYSNIPPNIDILIRLDNDVILEPRSIKQVATRFNQDSDLAILGVQSFLDDSPLTKCSGAWYFNWGLNTQYVRVPEQMVECDSVVGNFMAIRNSSIQQLKYLFDEKLFITFDDCELCIRIKKYLNQKVVFDPSIICYHRCGSSTAKVKRFVTYCYHRNSIFIFKKYAPRNVYFAAGVIVIFLRLFKAFLLGDRLRISGYLDGALSRFDNTRICNG
ncbi:MAG: glycosyltransferase [Nostoc sp. RI_552]|nr:glycosyltransferase [Nostoc sp. RI_552]